MIGCLRCSNKLSFLVVVVFEVTWPKLLEVNIGNVVFLTSNL